MKKPIITIIVVLITNISLILSQDAPIKLEDDKIQSYNEERLRQMKEAAIYMSVGTTFQLFGALKNLESDSHTPTVTLHFPSHMEESHSHAVNSQLKLIAIGSAINLIGIWKMYNANLPKVNNSNMIK